MFPFISECESGIINFLRNRKYVAIITVYNTSNIIHLVYVVSMLPQSPVRQGYNWMGATCV